jgi:N-acetylmuramoyl-L-alanine amidase
MPSNIPRPSWAVQHPLLNKETGVYSYDQLIIAEKDSDGRPAGGDSIINRDEELKMDSPERRDSSAAVSRRR